MGQLPPALIGRILNGLGNEAPDSLPFNIRVETLKTNRRSETRIIEFNNHIFRAAVNQLNETHKQELGIGCCIIGALSNELTTKDKNNLISVKEMLGLNDKQILLSLITLGYEKEHSKTIKSRKDFDEVVSLEKLGVKFT